MGRVRRFKAPKSPQKRYHRQTPPKTPIKYRHRPHYYDTPCKSAIQGVVKYLRVKNIPYDPREVFDVFDVGER